MRVGIGSRYYPACICCLLVATTIAYSQEEMADGSVSGTVFDLRGAPKRWQSFLELLI